MKAGTFRDWLIYALAKCGWSALGLVPLGLLFRIGACGGWLAWLLMPGYRKLAENNLRIAFGDKELPARIRTMAREHFQRLGGNLFAGVRLSGMSPVQLRQVLRVENAEIAEKAKAAGKGVIFVISHLGNWELMSHVSVVSPALSGGTIYQKLRNPYFDRHVQRIRERYGLVTFDRGDGFDGPIQYLRQGGGLGILIDQHAGDHGIWMPFFGRLASTSPLAAMLQARTGAALVPLAVYTDGPGRWRLVVSPPVEPARRDLAATTYAINRHLEEQIRVSPPDWFWVHNRWKTPQPDFLINSSKRGVFLPKGMEAETLKPFRIVIRSSNWLGDAVMTLPTVRAIRQGRPDARVTILCKEKLADVWRAVPWVDEVLAIPARSGVWEVTSMVRYGAFDVAVVLPNSLRTALEMFLAGVPRRVGYSGHSRRWLLNQIVAPVKPGRPPKHQVYDYLRIAKQLGAKELDPSVAIYPHEPDLGPELRIGLCPGAEYGPAKRWPPGAYGLVLAEVARRRSVKWVLFGTPAEQELGEEIASMASESCENLIGKTSLSELISELSRCTALLTNDTGTMHLATLLDVPVIALFGSTEPRLTGPLGTHHRVIRHQVECSPCFLRECPIDFRCMKAIEVDEVVEAVLRMVDVQTTSQPSGR